MRGQERSETQSMRQVRGKIADGGRTAGPAGSGCGGRGDSAAGDGGLSAGGTGTVYQTYRMSYSIGYENGNLKILHGKGKKVD
ncbi:hypothetical protein PDUR_05180 [Paenibacillus durus]|uniref:Uncharacterized protein n=1 Tax=Paenibacillus durus TaxID=44251 RepID=A0A089HL85_PAEDU|nr:hypothetical protein PDUR_05180 [Paenibacillus durus]